MLTYESKQSLVPRVAGYIHYYSSAQIDIFESAMAKSAREVELLKYKVMNLCIELQDSDTESSSKFFVLFSGYIAGA